jgi:hypothetical protein
MWPKNAFDEWREFWGFDTKKIIIDLAKNEQTIMELENMLSMFIFQIAKKDGSLYPPTSYESLNAIL